MDDTTLIDAHGGPSKLAAELGYDKGGTQRVFNWKARGRIPSDVKLARQDLFGPEAVRAAEQRLQAERAIDQRAVDLGPAARGQVAGQGA